MTARAMANCALTELRIVKPRDPWPLGEIHQQRMAAAASAQAALQDAKLFETVEEAIADLNYVYATTSRTHDMVNEILRRAAIPDMMARTHEEPENRRDVRTRAHGPRQRLHRAGERQITIPLNPISCRSIWRKRFCSSATEVV